MTSVVEEQGVFHLMCCMVETPLLERKSSCKVTLKPILQINEQKKCFEIKTHAIQTYYVGFLFGSVEIAMHKAHESERTEKTFIFMTSNLSAAHELDSTRDFC